MHKVTLTVDNVNMPYHHGNLREALIDAALGLAREGGPDAVVLRAATRAAGVSHNAAYRHFEDRDALLAAVCERCMGVLLANMERRLDAEGPATDPETARRRLLAVGWAYVEFALSEPGWFRTAFGVPRGKWSHSGSAEMNPYRLLNEVLDELVETGALPAAKRPRAEMAAWSAVHGISTLLLDGPLRDLPEPERQPSIDRVLVAVLDGL